MNKKNLKKIFFSLRTGRNRFFFRNGTASSPLNPMIYTVFHRISGIHGIYGIYGIQGIYGSYGIIQKC